MIQKIEPFDSLYESVAYEGFPQTSSD